MTLIGSATPLPEPLDLLLVARRLSRGEAGHPQTDAQRRRAISTAYYALFHKMLRAAADRFIGAAGRNSPAYALLYRGYDHARMRTVCEDIDKTTLSDKYRLALRRTNVSQDMRDVASAFPALQEMRHQADYHPSYEFKQADVDSTIDSAQAAMDAFDRVAPDEQADMLALLMVGVRR